MKKYFRVEYRYLATGMEGIEDYRDYGIVEAESKEEAIEKVASSDPNRNCYDKETNPSYRYWGLTARLA